MECLVIYAVANAIVQCSRVVVQGALVEGDHCGSQLILEGGRYSFAKSALIWKAPITTLTNTSEKSLCICNDRVKCDSFPYKLNQIEVVGPFTGVEAQCEYGALCSIRTKLYVLEESDIPSFKIQLATKCGEGDDSSISKFPFMKEMDSYVESSEGEPNLRYLVAVATEVFVMEVPSLKVCWCYQHGPINCTQESHFNVEIGSIMMTGTWEC